jgi:hypothetical protein
MTASTQQHKVVILGGVLVKEREEDRASFPATTPLAAWLSS